MKRKKKRERERHWKREWEEGERANIPFYYLHYTSVCSFSSLSKTKWQFHEEQNIDSFHLNLYNRPAWSHQKEKRQKINIFNDKNNETKKVNNIIVIV